MVKNADYIDKRKRGTVSQSHILPTAVMKVQLILSNRAPEMLPDWIAPSDCSFWIMYQYVTVSHSDLPTGTLAKRTHNYECVDRAVSQLTLKATELSISSCNTHSAKLN